MIANLRSRLRSALVTVSGVATRFQSKPFSLDLQAPAFRENPYPFFITLRERDPVHFHPLGVWFVGRYADAVQVCTDPRFAHPPYAATGGPGGRIGAFEIMRSNILISRNPPEHTRLRKIFTDIFTKRFIDAWQPRIASIADELLERASRNQTMDVVGELAQPLPLRVISEILGLPPEDRPMLTQWSSALVSAMDVAPSADVQRRVTEAARSFEDYFRARVNERRRRPGDDAISMLVAAQARDSGFTDAELIANAGLLFSAGHETAVLLIASGVLLLLRNPDELAKLRAAPSLMPQAIEEFLRYEPPIQCFGRIAVEDVSLGGKEIRKGQTVYVLIGAANRDPQHFPDPERLDIERPRNVHRTFGHGIHNCIGQYLARVEGATAIGALLRKFPNLRLDLPEPQWRPMMAFRGLSSLKIRFD